MHPGKLLDIARCVGLSQVAVARHLGITAIQVSRWTHGKRPLPQKHLEKFWRLIMDKLQDFLESGQADLGENGKPRRGLTAGEKTPFRRDLEALLLDLQIEYLELRGTGPSAWIESTFVALDALPRDPKELRKPANAARMIKLGRDIVRYGELLEHIGPIQTLLEETQHADDPH
jgi:hypothetical protein